MTIPNPLLLFYLFPVETVRIRTNIRLIFDDRGSIVSLQTDKFPFVPFKKYNYVYNLVPK